MNHQTELSLKMTAIHTEKDCGVENRPELVGVIGKITLFHVYPPKSQLFKLIILICTLSVCPENECQNNAD